MPTQGLPQFAVLWFIISGLIVILDASFVLLRPISMPGGSLAFLYGGWHKYITHDKRYADTHDAFVVVQSWLNLVEVAFQFMAVAAHLQKGPSCALKLGFFVSVATFYKTVIYFSMEYAEGLKFTRHNSLPDLILYVVIPSFVWLAMPLKVAGACWSRLTPAQTTQDKTPKMKSN